MPRRPTTGSGSAAGYAPAAWLLAGPAQGAAAAPDMAPEAADNTTSAQAGAVAGGVTPDATAAPVEHAREDLTVFFSVGVVLDVLLVAAFLVWAVKQWRKTG